MPVKIRLQRHGKKGKPFYWVVAADARAKRDGKFLEKLGTYNPNTNPATINLNVDGSVKWLENGAQPTDTARAILSYKGVMLKHHLNGGVRKGALTEEQAQAKFEAWLKDKESAIQDKVDGLDKAKADARAKALEAEKEVSEKRAAALLPEVEAPAEEAPAEEAAAEGEVAAEAEAPAETEAATEAPAEEVAEPAAEEAPAEAEAAPAEKAPAAEEAPAEEAGEEEAPKAE
jgi:small subunit ribosomal protein S16